MAALSHIDHWIFDLDNTLYPAHSALFPQIDRRMGLYIQRLLNVDPIEAHRIQKELYHSHGMTLPGLMALHNVDPHDFLANVHDVDIDVLRPHPELGDMIARLSRDDAARKYESAMDTAVRLAWLAAKAYDYETSLSPGHPANALTVLEDLMKVRQLGQWDGDTPKVGNGGLAEILAKLKSNYQFLGRSIGLETPFLGLRLVRTTDGGLIGG